MNISELVNWSNETLNLSISNLYSNLCPFEAIALPNYNFLVLFNFFASFGLFLEIRYNFQKNLEFSPERIERNRKLMIVLMAVFNTIFLLNQFLMVPLFNYIRVIYGV